MSERYGLQADEPTLAIDGETLGPKPAQHGQDEICRGDRAALHRFVRN